GFGITYDLKDTGGNQLNFLTPGVADTDGDGVISLPEEQVPRGTDVVALGGNSIAALGNAGDRIVGPTLSVLTSLVVGRGTLVGFIDALDAIELTNVEAQPSVRVMDNRTARILVGEETPVRVLDAGAQLQPGAGDGGGGSLPVATVDYMETGVILEVSPRITDGGDIFLDLSAERSSADLAPSDVGLTFRRQKAESQVLLRDGETVVIGGLTVAEEGEVRSGIPLLMDLPLIGWLFATERKSSVQRDLLIMVTPTIVRGTSP
ncbi:MAG: type II and III secretion system protein, partial [Gemmatimonadetes bacterium]|nr:type II and III secretion system protein [Gemmatimonadota bacterium]